MPTFGGIPQRITFHGGNDRLLGWNPEGDKLLFASSRESGRQRFNQFYLISTEGGMAEKLPLPYAEFGSFSPDSNLSSLSRSLIQLLKRKVIREITATLLKVKKLSNITVKCE